MDYITFRRPIDVKAGHYMLCLDCEDAITWGHRGRHLRSRRHAAAKRRTTAKEIVLATSGTITGAMGDAARRLDEAIG